MADFVPLASMDKAERMKFKQEIEDLLSHAARIGLNLSTDINGQLEIKTQLKQRKRGEGLRFMSKKDMSFGSAFFGRNPLW